jgi:hypothetical protein
MQKSPARRGAAVRRGKLNQLAADFPLAPRFATLMP